METFNEKTDYHKVIEFIPKEEWNRPMLSFYKGIDIKNEKFNSLLNRALPHKRLELIYAHLNNLNTSIGRLTKPQEKKDSNEGEDFTVQSYEDWFDLERMILYQYTIGNNPSISFFYDYIIKVYSYYVYLVQNDLNGDFITIDRQAVKFGDSLEKAAIGILNALLNEITRDTIGLIEEKKRIEGLIHGYQAPDILINNSKQKLTWLGKPAHLALIIDLLIEKGYMEATPYGERTAKLLLEFIDIKGYKNDVEGLGKHLHKDKFPISDRTVIDRFYRIPERKELK